jgi:solute carrier family 25 citrate transporter 1
MLKQGSNQAIRFFVMESLKEQYRKYKSKGPNDPVPVLVTGIFGLIAGAASVFGNTPLDVVKTRMQSLEAAKYKSTLDCAIRIMRNEGPLAYVKNQKKV